MRNKTSLNSIRAFNVHIFSLVGLILLVFLTPSFAQTGRVKALFDLETPARSPFPSDRFTTPDTNQNTGRRVNLPLPDCTRRPSDCEDIGVLNTLDGFNMQPRISVPFDGDIDPASINSETVFLMSLGDSLARRSDLSEGDDDSFEPSDVRLASNAIVGINNIVWDPATHELSFRPDNPLAQHTTYVLVVTTGVRDTHGEAIGVADGFRRFRSELAHDTDRYYRRALLTADWAVRRVVGREEEIAALSVFTTQSASHIIERMREEIQRAPAPTLDFGVGPGGARAVFSAAKIEVLTKNLQTRTTGPLTPQAVSLPQLGIVPGAVGTVAFGKFRTLDFTVRPSGHVAPIPTRTGTLAPTGSLDVAFNLWLPAGTPPAGGWPVAIYGHGSVGHKDTAFAHAALLNSHGIAVIAINAVGRGGGPLTTMTIRLTDGTTTTFAAPGLGHDANGDGVIAAWEPQRAQRPYALLNTSGSMAQATAQYFALVRGIQSGVDVDGDGAPDLDASRIYYLGQSLGSNWGVLVFAYEPAVRAAVFNVPSGTLIYNTNFSAVNRPGLGQLLAARTPSLLNSAYGLTSIDGVAVAGPHYNENLPLRDLPPRVNTVPGAIDIQCFIDRIAWAAQITSTVAFAPLLRQSPPAAGPARPFLIQSARSDQNVVNPSATELIRAGDFADRVLFYRHDLNFGLAGVPPDPHAFLSSIGPTTPNLQRIALGAQHQIGTFFETDGAVVTHPTPTHLWEAPINCPLPEDTFFLPRPR